MAAGINEIFNHTFNSITNKVESIADKFKQYNAFLKLDGAINRDDLVKLIYSMEKTLVETRKLYGLDFDIDQFDAYQLEKKNIEKAFNITVNIKQNTVHIIFPGIIPKRSQDTYMRDSLTLALEDKFKKPLQLEDVVVIFIYHFAENVRTFDYDNLETRSVLNVLTKFVIKDDSPKQIDLYQTASFDGETFTEIWIIPKNQSDVKQWLSLLPGEEK